MAKQTVQLAPLSMMTDVLSTLNNIMSAINQLDSIKVDIDVNGEISIGNVPIDKIRAGGRILSQSTERVSHSYTIKEQDCDGSPTIYVLLFCFGIVRAGSPPYYVHTEPSTTGQIMCLLNSSTPPNTCNTTLMVAKVSVGDIICDNLRASVSTYPSTSLFTLYRIY